MKLTKFGKPTFWRVLSAGSALLLALSIAGTAVTSEWSGYINKFLGISNTQIVQGDGDEDPIHYKSDYTSYTETMNNARDVAKRIQGEGTVLMTNKNNALPLKKGANVTYFSYSSADVALGGTGSGGVSASEERKIDLMEASKLNGKLNPNETMYNFYKGYIADGYEAKNGAITRKSGGGWGANAAPTKYQAPEVDPSLWTSEVKASFSDYSDAAIFILTRIGGEGNDLTTSSAKEGEYKYLELNDGERAVLQAMKEGNFSKRIVLVNTFNTPELGWLDEYDIDACLYIGGPGEVGLDAVTDILVGNTNPSGKLADTYAYDSFSSPAMQNFGNFQYTNSADVTNSDSNKYLMYNEGIYVGYRYYETRYEDTVLNQGNAASKAGVWDSKNNWNYSEEVQFSFGHGLSYSTFTQKLDNVRVNWSDKTATVTVKVTNTGSVAGKEVVEVYAQAPYVQGGVEKSAVQLCGFAKTSELKAGDSETIEIIVDLNSIASYDYENYKTYIMDKGNYYFAIGSSAHDALNNILAAKGYGVDDGMTADGDADKAVKAVKTGFDAEEYMLSATNKKVTNQFEETDINYYTAGTKDEVTYLSRSDWSGTWPKNMTGFAATDQMLADIASMYDADNNTTAYTPGSTDTSSITLGAEKKYTIAMMIGADYDDPAWDLLLDQITLDEMAAFCKQGRTAIESIDMPATTAVDGPAAWTKSTYKVKYDDYSAEAEKTSEAMVGYPTETVIAGTWNVDLTYELGVSFGEEGLWGGGVGWYGPGANIHRTPYAGRNFEYFSEDGFISGTLSEAESKGAMSKGVIPYLKHFFLNDQETNRIGVCTFSNEQALREIYLRGFQYAFETTGEDDKACTGVMGAFNRLGVTWSGHHSKLWNEVMRGEWGFTGNITTDFGQKPQSLMDPMLAYEAGTTMFCTSGNSFYNIIVVRAESDLKLLTNMREATHRILYNFANSLAMNGLTSTSKIVTIPTWYETALNAMTIASAVIFVLTSAMVVVQAFAKKED